MLLQDHQGTCEVDPFPMLLLLLPGDAAVLCPPALPSLRLDFFTQRMHAAVLGACPGRRLPMAASFRLQLLQKILLQTLALKGKLSLAFYKPGDCFGNIFLHGVFQMRTF